jgi:outer membrane immunogenic protein
MMMAFVRVVFGRIEGSVMRRRLVVALGLFAFVAQASAQEFDVPTLRGTSPFIPAAPVHPRWDGFYVGGQASHGSSGMNFAGSTSDLVAFVLRETTIEDEFNVSDWELLGRKTASGFGFGAFAGYNTQWENVIFGIDATYTRYRLKGASTATLARQFVTSDDINNQVSITGEAALAIKDVFTIRGRAGAAFGSFLPYATVGVAIGLADFTRSAVVTAQGTNVGPPPTPAYDVTYAASANKKNMPIYGYAAGLGTDIAMGRQAFLRAEWEWVQFTAPSDINAYISTIRGGVGLRF